MTLEEAAKSVGITYRTLRRWVKTGEDELARVEDGKPGLKLKKSLKIYTDFVVQYKQAMVNRRKVLYQASSLVALGGYRLKENHTTRVYKDGQLVNVIEINKEKEVGPDGNLALKLLQYDDTQSGGENKEETPADGQWSLDDWLRAVEQRRAEAAATAALFEEAEGHVPPG